MKLFSLLLVTVSLLGVSCERHEFEGPDGTKQLHEHHSGHAAGGDHAEAGDNGHAHGDDHKHEDKSAH